MTEEIATDTPEVVPELHEVAPTDATKPTSGYNSRGQAREH